MIDIYLDKETGVLKNKLGINNSKDLEMKEKEIFNIKWNTIFKDLPYRNDYNYIKDLHYYLFGEIYPFAGEYRTIDLVKPEDKLVGYSVDYAKSTDIESNIKVLMDTIEETDFYSLNREEKIDFITSSLVFLWKTHPFREGNTRTALIFLRSLLKSYGIEFSNEWFIYKNNYEYTRDALVAASFENEELSKKEDFKYIRKEIEDIMAPHLSKEK